MNSLIYVVAWFSFTSVSELTKTIETKSLGVKFGQTSTSKSTMRICEIAKIINLNSKTKLMIGWYCLITHNLRRIISKHFAMLYIRFNKMHSAHNSYIVFISFDGNSIWKEFNRICCFECCISTGNTHVKQNQMVLYIYNIEYYTTQTTSDNKASGNLKKNIHPEIEYNDSTFHLSCIHLDKT